MNILRPAVVLAAMVLLTACGNPEADWQQAEAENTEAAYQAFLERHADGEWAQRARMRLDELKDSGDWEKARTADAIEAYNAYLLAHPAGGHLGEARQRITELETEASWAAAQAIGTREAIEDFLLRYADTPQAEQARAQLAALAPPAPTPPPPARAQAKAPAKPPARQPAAKPATSAPTAARGDFQVQLGAFSTAAKAQAEKSRLEQRFRATTGSLVVQKPTGADQLHRVRSVPMTEAAARAACEKLEGAGQDCVVVRR
ncbi:MAG: SPOR domain-containing protein [Gammaproteobacteria bacterium]|nr:SPOR domain-containing protein [Gammaproteobacteria bacterium]